MRYRFMLARGEVAARAEKASTPKNGDHVRGDVEHIALMATGVDCVVHRVPPRQRMLAPQVAQMMSPKREPSAMCERGKRTPQQSQVVMFESFFMCVL
jgi:hypothetical protein